MTVTTSSLSAHKISAETPRHRTALSIRRTKEPASADPFRNTVDCMQHREIRRFNIRRIAALRVHAFDEIEAIFIVKNA
jgi:hypothetical protein